MRLELGHTIIEQRPNSYFLHIKSGPQTIHKKVLFLDYVRLSKS